VINFELSDVSETYVHRIGRTGRAGASGKALSFVDGFDLVNLKNTEKLIGKKIPVVTNHPFHTADLTVQKRDSNNRAVQKDKRPADNKTNDPKRHNAASLKKSGTGNSNNRGRSFRGK